VDHRRPAICRAFGAPQASRSASYRKPLTAVKSVCDTDFSGTAIGAIPRAAVQSANGDLAKEGLRRRSGRRRHPFHARGIVKIRIANRFPGPP
jgi:hypothetical protein